MFFIIGPGRSGNTLLRRLLIERTNAAIPSEIYGLDYIIKLGRCQMAWPDFVHASVDWLETKNNQQGLLTDFQSFKEKLLLENTPSNKAGYLIDSFYRHECSFIKSDFIYGDKTPINTFVALDLIKCIKPVRFIFLLRIPQDVVWSYLDSGLIHDYDLAISRIERSYKVLRRLINRRLVLPIFYESIVKNTDQTLRRISSYIGLENECHDLRTINLGDISLQPHHSKSTSVLTLDSIGNGFRHLTHHQLVKCDRLYEQYSFFLRRYSDHGCFGLT